jgi:hypothetical protein
VNEWLTCLNYQIPIADDTLCSSLDCSRQISSSSSAKGRIADGRLPPKAEIERLTPAIVSNRSWQQADKRQFALAACEGKEAKYINV